MKVVPFHIHPRHGELSGAIHIPGGTGPVGTVILCHDLLSHPHDPLLTDLARGLAGAGYLAVQFAFGCCGFDARGRLSKEGALAGASVTGMMADLGGVVDHVVEYLLPAPERVDTRRVAVLGDGMGGAVAFLRAARDSRIKALVGLGTPASPAERFRLEHLEAWWRRGECQVELPTHERVRLGQPLVRELAHRFEGPTVAAAAEELRIPYLLIHADGDPRVPLASAERVFFANSERGAMHILRGGEAAPHQTAVGARDALPQVRDFLQAAFG